LETWTLLSVLGGMTERVRLFPNVADLPLHPPAMLAKAAASLDVLTNGRVELGLGAGAFWDAIAGYGGTRRTPGEAVAALEEAMKVMRRLWQPQGSARVSFAGQFYQLDEARPGPAPAHAIGHLVGCAQAAYATAHGPLGRWLVGVAQLGAARTTAARACDHRRGGDGKGTRSCINSPQLQRHGGNYRTGAGNGTR